MLILFPHVRNSASQQVDAPLPKRCEFVDHVAAYTARQIDSSLRDDFERHLIDCGPCQRAVHLGRISTPMNSHNRSVGKPCAAQTRRKT